MPGSSNTGLVLRTTIPTFWGFNILFSIVDIADLMRNVRPDVVFLELDEQRMRRVLSRKWRANEFLAAHLLAKRLPDCEVVLGDRNANVTLMRVGFKGLKEFLRMPFLEENRASRERIVEIIT